MADRKTKGQHEEEMLKYIAKNKLPTLAETLALIPYDGLTETQRKMLAAMSVPAISRLMAVKQAAYATIDRHTWCSNVNMDAFQDARAKFFRELLKEAIPKVAHAFVDGALLGSKAFPAGNPIVQQRILEQTAVLDVQAKGGTSVQVNVVVVNEKRQESIKTGLSRFGFTVSDN
jgi:hypothetical protein